jgi:hypothetical protein
LPPILTGALPFIDKKGFRVSALSPVTAPVLVLAVRAMADEVLAEKEIGADGMSAPISVVVFFPSLKP